MKSKSLKHEEAQLTQSKKKLRDKKISQMRQAKLEEQSLSSEPVSPDTPLEAQPSKPLIPPPLPSSPCTLRLIPSPPPTPTPVPSESPPSIPKLPPPTRSLWTPFSHASVDLNLFARPDFENVCQGVYQSFYLGALSPHENPYPVVLPELSKSTSIDTTDGHLPESIESERANNIFQSLKNLGINDQQTTVLQEIAKVESVESEDTSAVNTPNSVGSPWSSFVFDPKPNKSKPESPALSNKSDGRVPGSPGASCAPLLEMFSAKVPMTPVRARRDSKFVSTNDNAVHIHDIAYAQDNGNGAQVLCKAVINKSYTPDVGPQTPGRTVPTLTYVGFEYSDQTCLTYIPIMDTRLIYKGMKKERLFGEEVPMMMKRSVFEKIKEMSIRAYLESHPGMRIDCGVVEMQGKYITTGVMVKANRTVKIELEYRTVYRPALETLNLCKHDITGEALLHVRFSKTPDKDLAQLRFILFGIQITRTEANKGLRIFELVENEGQDGNGNSVW